MSVPVQSADRASGTRLSDTGPLLVGVWAGSSPPVTLPFPRYAGGAASCRQTKHRQVGNFTFSYVFSFPKWLQAANTELIELIDGTCETGDVTHKKISGHVIKGWTQIYVQSHFCAHSW